jgi:hypothetical protein
MLPVCLDRRPFLTLCPLACWPSRASDQSISICISASRCLFIALVRAFGFHDNHALSSSKCETLLARSSRAPLRSLITLIAWIVVEAEFHPSSFNALFRFREFLH